MTGKNNKKELVVIGAGPGGYTGAFLAADLGLRVTLIDPESNPGGVCLYRGCIPSKALLHLAKIITDAAEAKNFGVEFTRPKIDVDQIQSWKDSVVEKLTQGLGLLRDQRKIEYIQGVASFLDSNTIEVKAAADTTERISFDHAILATGSHPATIPNIPEDSPLVMDSTKALELENIPKSMLVIGGGYIGLELGSVYAVLGTKVSVVEMKPGLMPGMDPELVRVLQKRLERLFDSIMLGTTVARIEEQKDGLKVTFEGANTAAQERIFEKVLVCVGRKPNSSGLGLENTNVQIDDKGFVKVDKKRRTDDDSIYAVGDVTGGMLLAHKAAHEARVATKAIAGLDAVFEPRAIPFVEYTDPEIAECGLTEKQAKEENRDIKVAKFPWAASGRAATLGQNQGLTKLIIDPNTERVLGVGIVGTGAGQLISEGALAVEMAAAVSDLALTIHPHPTLSETIMEAAEVFLGHSTHFYRPRKT